MSKWLTKKTIGIIVFSSVIAIMGSMSIYENLQVSTKLQLTNNEMVIEYGSDLILDPTLYVETMNQEVYETMRMEVFRENDCVEDTSLLDVGVYRLVFYYEEQKLEMKFYVVDTQAPIITLKQKEVVMNYGSEWNVEEYVESVRDVVDGELNYCVEGDVDVKKAGVYLVTIMASDKNGLVVEEDLQVQVKEKLVSVSHNKENKVTVNPEDGKVDKEYDPLAGVIKDDVGDKDEKEELKPWSVQEVPLERRGDGGLAFATKEEAINWANKQIYSESSQWYGYKYMLSQIQKYGQKRLVNDPWAVTFIPVKG